MVDKLLEKATGATREGNCSLANQYLQQLSLETTSQFQQALDIALAVLEQGDFQQRWDVAKIFPKFGAKAIPSLIAILEDEEVDLEQRWFAGRILGEFNHPDAIATLVNLLQNTEDEDLAGIAASALANSGQTAIEGLTNLLTHPNSRLLATCSLAQIRRPEIVPPLLTVVADEDVSVRATAIAALSSFRNPSIPPVLIAALDDIAAAVRKEAVIGLGLRTDLATELDLLNHIKPRLYDFNLEVCQQAAIALGRLGSDEAAAALFRVLESPATPIPLQMSLIQTLGWMATPASLQYLELSLSLVASESVLEIIRVLGRTETKNLKTQAAQILLDFFHCGHAMVGKNPVKQALAHAWGQLASELAIKPLRKLQADSDVHVRLHAIAALKNFPS
ncbi:MAG: HEAT repeat domain-containing protein [Nostocaceae cyanobacterium]|nr:HEAT repeat domain-containing protein [Nostocaceae cyanobacterium]